MQVLKYITQKEIVNKLGKEVGYGADGQVFEYLPDLNKVIKISILFDDYRSCLKDNYDKVISNISYIRDNCPKLFCKVYECDYLESGDRCTVNGRQDYILYYYVLDKLNKIYDDEKRVFYSLLSGEDFEEHTEREVNSILSGMKYGLQFDYDKVLSFYKEVRSSVIKHDDLHVRNIMKDNSGNFKLIDFDRMEKVEEVHGPEKSKSRFDTIEKVCSIFGREVGAGLCSS